MLTLREKHEYEQEIADLKSELLLMKYSRDNYKAKLVISRCKYKEVNSTRDNIVRGLLLKRFNGEKISLQEISNISDVSYANVANLSTEFNNSHKTQLV